MTRLPQPGKDNGDWGDILNTFLEVEHNSDGTLRRGDDIDQALHLAGAAPTALAQLSDVNVGTPSNAEVLTYSATSHTWVPSTVTSTVVSDAAPGVKGIVQLSGDLGGTANSPTVPGLSSKEPAIAGGTVSQYWRGDKSWQALDKTSVGLTNVDNTSDSNKPISSAVQTALAAKQASLGYTAEDTSNKDTDASLSANSDTKYPSQKAIKSYVDTQLTSSAAPDATSSAKGVVQLAGDLGGTATSPTLKNVSKVYNVKDYGAIGNGVADDYAAITAAITTAGTNGGGIVYFPNGTYGVKSYLQPNYDNLILRGDGGRSSIIRDISTSGLGFVVRIAGDTNALPRSNIMFENLDIDGNNLSTVGMTLHNPNYYIIRNCRIGNCKVGSSWALNIDSLDSANNYNVKAYDGLIEKCEFYGAGATQDLVAITKGRKAVFRDCIMRDPQTGANSYISISDGTFDDINIENCRLYETVNSGTSGIFTSLTGQDMRVTNCDIRVNNNGIVLGGTDVTVTGNYIIGGIVFRTTTTPTRAKITNNTIDTSALAASGINVTGSDHYISGNYITPTNSGIYLSTTAVGCTVIGNKVHNANSGSNSYSGIDNYGDRNMLISNHLIDDRATPIMKYGIRLSSATNTTVFGNRIQGAVTDAILQDGTTNNTYMDGNIVTSGSSVVVTTGTQVGAVGTANVFSTLLGTSGNTVFQLNDTTSAVNYFTVTNGAAGNGVLIQAGGSDTNIAATFQSKAGGAVNLQAGSNSTQAVRVRSAGGSTVYTAWDTTNGRMGVGFNPITPTAIIDVTGGTTAHAQLRLRSGLAPTAANDGEFWNDGNFLNAHIGGSTRKVATLGITNKATTYTATVADDTILCDATAAAFVVTLPTAASMAGEEFVVKKTDSSAHAVTVGTTSSQTIDGLITYALSAQYKYVRITSDGANWLIVGNN